MSRSELRKEANRTIAYYVESTGQAWTSVRTVLNEVSRQCQIAYEDRKRSDIAIDCLYKLRSLGVVVPVAYIPPWNRANHQQAVFFEPRETQRQKDTTEFYLSWEWKRLRYEVLQERGAICECCGAGRSRAIQINVDHIKPVRRFWHLRLVKENLQVLCSVCNQGKGSRYETDWRR